ncbi:MAG: L-seryl-tRNA(Sec) selenium transferase [Rhodospirillales bacterium]|nr:L-seryl-tRNA(Sec) selenium transferase [Rhodospirillales bacterium]MBN8897443.1 L-seryl-tRNA(Sec) selenium transferase [Rhodospirillales bacterium]
MGGVEEARPSSRAGLRALPSVQRLLEAADGAGLLALGGRSAVVAALRAALADARTAILAGAPVPDDATLLAAASAALAAAPALRPVLNATGIVLHTNLGRAPLAEEAVAMVAAVAGGYANLEFDLESGRRGTRDAAVEHLLCELTGAEAALVVNNNAAAVLLALSALAAGGEVVVSRGELVEIGGGFRIPEVIAQGGARLVEVGTTNKTRLADYRAALRPETRVLLRVHPSNYRIQGFTAAPALAELVGLARETGLPLVEDLGSGALLDLAGCGLPNEPTVRASITAGVDLVAFSGDKLLGGPQAGILVGRAAMLAPLRRHPLLRAVRIDKLSLAALQATLRLYADPRQAMERVPALRMLATPAAVLQARAVRLAALIGAAAEVVPAEGFAGGGTLPVAALPGWAVAVSGPADTLAARLRRHDPPVIGRIAAARLLLDVRTLPEDALPQVAAAVRAAQGA